MPNRRIVEADRRSNTSFRRSNIKDFFDCENVKQKCFFDIDFWSIPDDRLE